MIPRFKPSLGLKEFSKIFKFNANSIKKFEKEFAKTFKAVDAVAFPYGRAAQWAFFNAIGLKNTEIIMPAYTCSVVAHSISLSENTPRFVDINLDDFNMNLDKLRGTINERTRCIIATHTFGYPQDLDVLEEIVRGAEKRFGHKIWLMQDCCHAFGAEHKGRTIGTSGDVAVYAFNISKIMNSIFGGMLTFQDQDLANKVRIWRDENFKRPSLLKSLKRRIYLLTVYISFNKLIYGFTFWLQNSTKFLDPFTKSYHLDDKIHFPPDYLEKMTSIEAAVGLVQLKRYPKIIEHRRKMANYYSDNLDQKDDWKLPPLVDGANYSHYAVRVPNKGQVMKDYLDEGIQLGELIQYSVPDLECYKHIGDECPNARLASRTTINFPVTK